uniref:Septenin 1e n=1 Tax=Osteopilus septentrionalis TaxID=317373 RepID=SEP1E_OSTSE|nr:RecName: Full=Septenin 1e [Osteopilus septentrionalis]
TDAVANGVHAISGVVDT